MYLGVRLVHVNVDQMQVFVIINSIGIMINADVNANNLFRFIWSASVCECECDKSWMLENIQIIKIVNVKKTNLQAS